MVQVPIVVVGNKTDQARTTAQPELEAVASLDWEHGYVECSARDNTNVDQVTGVSLVSVVMVVMIVVKLRMMVMMVVMMVVMRM